MNEATGPEKATSSVVETVGWVGEAVSGASAIVAGAVGGGRGARRCR